MQTSRQLLFTTIFLVFLAMFLLNCSTENVRPDIDPPVALQKPVELTLHDHTRIDPYYWLNDRDNPEVIAYIEDENDYLVQMMAHTEDLQEQLFEEMRGRIREDDSSVPVRIDGFYYYTRYEEGGEYPLYARKKGSLDADEEIILNANEMGEGSSYFQVMNTSVSPDHSLLAFAIDTVGRRVSTLFVKNLDTGELLNDVIQNVTGNMAWANDNRTIFYTRQHPTTLRSYQTFRHTLGGDPATSELVYQEDDETFRTYVYRTKSRAYVGIGSFSTVSTEHRVLSADNPGGRFRVVQPRERDHEYYLDHYGDHFYIKTNLDARNFRLMRTPVNSTAKAGWQEVIPHREDVLFEDIEIFKDHLVVEERADGLPRVRIITWENFEAYNLDFDEPAYYATLSDNPEYDTDLVRFVYTSLTTPMSTYDYNMNTRERELLKRTEVLGGFDPDNYVTERLYALTDDGIRVPVSVVYRQGYRKNGSQPLLVYGYGSYGYPMETYFSSSRLSLLDRGFAYAIAHIRGGQEMGREWYEDGKLFNKMNTFTDFIAVTEHLHSQGIGSPGNTFAFGGSAGGLLVGAVANMRPDLYHGIIAAVPFVDVVTTMLDDSIPLTTSEYDEWGNPNEPDYYEYMLSYSPYDNVQAMDYPHMLITSGLHDSQVQYFEPTKWTAKLREMKTDNNYLYLHTNMDAGHGGASGRFRQFRETALIYAFMFDLTVISN
ncbi:MAG: S9 family peptidase [Cyclonatronaceae bacterium]